MSDRKRTGAAALRIGIVGAGNIADTHARALREARGTVLTAVAGGRNAEAFAVEHDCRWFQDPEAMIGSGDVDAVSICTPSGARIDAVQKAAAAGVHVLVEKPIEVTAARAREAIDACEWAGVTLGVVFQSRMKPGPQAVRRAIRNGALGRIVFADVAVKWHRPEAYYASAAWRGTRALDGGGALMNQGIHAVDLLLWFVGEVRGIRARSGHLRHAIEVEDTIQATFDLASDGYGALQATTASYPGTPQRIDVHGTKGTVSLVGDDIVFWDVEGVPAPDLARGADTGGAASHAVSESRWHQMVFEDFAVAVTEGVEPAVSGREGARSLAFVLAAYQAAESGQAVDPIPIGGTTTG